MFITAKSVKKVYKSLILDFWELSSLQTKLDLKPFNVMGRKILRRFLVRPKKNSIPFRRMMKRDLKISVIRNNFFLIS
jgi:hypothetical protein